MGRSCQSINCMWFIRNSLIMFLFCAVAWKSHGQNLTGVIRDFSGDQVLLSYFSGDQRFVVDTFEVRKGTFAIQVKDYPPGFYTVILDKDHFFDLYLYNGFPNSNLTASFDAIDESMVWKGCPENQAFLEFRKKGIEVGKLVADGTLSGENASGIFDSWETEWAERNKHLRISTFLAARNPMPASDLSLQVQFRQWTKKYWQNCALDDPGMIRSPFLVRNLDFFFDKVCPPVPDSVIAALDQLFSLPIDPAVEDILISKLTIRFEGSKIMGMDKAFVYMVDRFYRTKHVTWETEENMQKIIRKADELSWNLIGSPAPDFEFYLSDGSKRKLSDFHNGTLHVLYFWDATCSHCQKTTPVLQEFYEKFKAQGVEVVAITTESELTEWKSYIATHKLSWVNGYDNHFDKITFRHYYYIPTTPLVMLLDGSGKILAKNISIEDLTLLVNEQLTN